MARTFEELRRTEHLTPFVRGRHGMMYTILSNGEPRSLVRHFDGDIPPSLARSYTSLWQAVYEWVARRPALSERIFVNPAPTETGADFLVRRFLVYFQGTRDFAGPENDDDEAIEPPDDLEEMRSLVGAATAEDLTLHSVMRRVLTRNLIVPAKKTYFNDETGVFVFVEPHVTKNDLDEWARRQT